MEVLNIRQDVSRKARFLRDIVREHKLQNSPSVKRASGRIMFVLGPTVCLLLVSVFLVGMCVWWKGKGGKQSKSKQNQSAQTGQIQLTVISDEQQNIQSSEQINSQQHLVATRRSAQIEAQTSAFHTTEASSINWSSIPQRFDQQRQLDSQYGQGQLPSGQMDWGESNSNQLQAQASTQRGVKQSNQLKKSNSGGSRRSRGVGIRSNSVDGKYSNSRLSQNSVWSDIIPGAPEVEKEKLVRRCLSIQSDWFKFIAEFPNIMATVRLDIDLEAEFEVNRFLGGGAVGQVFGGIWTDRDGNQKEVACKLLRNEVVDGILHLPGDILGEDMQSLFSELLLLLRLDHERIIHCYGASISLPLFGILVELMPGGTLADAIAKTHRKGLPVSKIVHYMIQVASACAYMHSLTPPVVHQDLKPHNILLDKSRSNCKVADLGLSRLMHGSHVTSTEHQAGTPAFMSPEQWNGTKVGPKQDVYALGMIIWMCLAGTIPFKEMANKYMVCTAVSIAGKRPPVVPTWNKELVDLMTDCWGQEPEDRPTSQQVLERLQILEGTVLENEGIQNSECVGRSKA